MVHYDPNSVYVLTNFPWAQITAIEAEDLNRQKIEWIRNFATMAKEEVEFIYQRVLQARNDGSTSENTAKRDEYEACSIDVDSNHPLW